MSIVEKDIIFKRTNNRYKIAYKKLGNEIFTCELFKYNGNELEFINEHGGFYKEKSLIETAKFLIGLYENMPNNLIEEFNKWDGLI